MTTQRKRITYGGQSPRALSFYRALLKATPPEGQQRYACEEVLELLKYGITDDGRDRNIIFEVETDEGGEETNLELDGVIIRFWHGINSEGQEIWTGYWQLERFKEDNSVSGNADGFTPEEVVRALLNQMGDMILSKIDQANLQPAFKP